MIKLILKKTTYLRTFVLLFTVASLVGLFTNVPTAKAFPKGLLFPVLNGGSFTNDYNGYRSLNGVHRATDIFAPKNTPVVAAVDGVVEWAPFPEPSWGWGVSIRDKEGFSYWYLHLNNDTPGTDDGRGGAMRAYAPDIPDGATVKRGQLLGYVGDSGNAETTPPHLHFEIIDNKTDERINPYPYLLEAQTPHVLNKDYPPVTRDEILPYGPNVNAQASIAVGSFTGNVKGLTVGTGPGYAPHIRVLNAATKNEIGGFYAYNPAQFTAGVDVATGDVNGDGVDEIISGTMRGAPHVRVLRLDGTEIGGFYAYAQTSTSGVQVATVDIDGDGKDEIVTGTGSGDEPLVKVFDATGKEKLRFFAYDSKFLGGVDVSSGDVVGDTKPEIVTVPGPGGSAHLRIFSTAGIAQGSGFNAYEAYTGYTGGARVSVGNMARSSQPDKAEIIVGPRLNGGPHFRLLRANGTPLRESYYYEQWWSGNYDVAADDGMSYVSTGGNRRSSIRLGPSM